MQTIRERPRCLLAVTVLLVSLLILMAACGDDDDDDGSANGDPTAQPTEDNGNGDAPTNGDQPDNGANGGEVAGTITVGDESWDIIPTIQCGNFYDAAGQIYISGVSAEDPAIEITLDYDDSIVAASVRREGGIEQPYWTSTDDTGLTFEVDGSVTRGSGTFRNFLSSEEADGSFEVTC